MAASAMASLPFHSSFAIGTDLLSEFFHGDDGIGTDPGAAGAGDALGDVRHGGGMVALVVHGRLVDGHDVLGTYGGTQLAALAALGVKC